MTLTQIPRARPPPVRTGLAHIWYPGGSNKTSHGCAGGKGTWQRLYSYSVVSSVEGDDAQPNGGEDMGPARFCGRPPCSSIWMVLVLVS